MMSFRSTYVNEVQQSSTFISQKKDSNYDFPQTTAYTLKLTVQFLILSIKFRSFIFSLQLQIIKVPTYYTYKTYILQFLMDYGIKRNAAIGFSVKQYNLNRICAML